MQIRALVTAFAFGVTAGCAASATTETRTVVAKTKPAAPRKKAPPPKPPAKLEATRIEIQDKVQFAFGSARILPSSYDLLRAVAKIMSENPQVTLVQVEGHTDDVGKPRKNRKLSQKRAESVRAFLIEEGVDAGRLVAVGFGEERPVAENDDDDGREQNRRVEFNILDQTDHVAKK